MPRKCELCGWTAGHSVSCELFDYRPTLRSLWLHLRWGLSAWWWRVAGR